MEKKPKDKNLKRGITPQYAGSGEREQKEKEQKKKLRKGRFELPTVS